jgi:hypothetical protein
VIFKVYEGLKSWEVYEVLSRFALNAGKDACAPVGMLSLAKECSRFALNGERAISISDLGLRISDLKRDNHPGLRPPLLTRRGAFEHLASRTAAGSAAVQLKSAGRMPALQL